MFEDCKRCVEFEHDICYEIQENKDNGATVLWQYDQPLITVCGYDGWKDSLPVIMLCHTKISSCSVRVRETFKIGIQNYKMYLDNFCNFLNVLSNVPCHLRLAVDLLLFYGGALLNWMCIQSNDACICIINMQVWIMVELILVSVWKMQ